MNQPLPDPIKIVVIGEPKSQPRKRPFIQKIGFKPDGSPLYRARMADPGTAENWKSEISAAAVKVAPFKPILGPIRVDITWYFPRPKDHYRTGQFANELKPHAPDLHDNTCDRDNLDKAVLDTLTYLGFWKNDAQVCGGTLWKFYCAPGQKPGALITITPLAPRPMRTQLITGDQMEFAKIARP